MTLSVLIPARREMWLALTVADVLAHSSETTEVLVCLDGEWSDPGLPQHPRLTVVKTPSAIGQRAATNLLARLSSATYVMKLDAHCSVAPGFDTELVAAAEALGPDVTQVPAQYNLHVFDWQCPACGHRTYQGPTPAACEQCRSTEPQERAIVWKPRKRRLTHFWRFDRDLHFQYWTAYKDRPEAQGDIVDVLSCLGACWFLRRDHYWALDGLDEAHGSWGQMGTEIACKAWLSGGRLVVNKRTWFAHLFRTQGGDFGFPYPMSGSQQEAARAYSQAVWREGRWAKAIRPLSWLVEKFAPVPDWHDAPAAPAVAAPRTCGIVYYSDCRGDAAILEACRAGVRAANLPTVSVTLAPVDLGQNIVLAAARGPLTMFRQILAGLEALDTDDVFFAEHDVLYHPSHFEFRPPTADRYYYNQHVWKVDAASGRALTYRCNQTSGLCADRQLLIAHYRARVARVEAEGFTRRMGFEPGGRHIRHGGVDDVPVEAWLSTGPNVDIRHGQNLTPSRWRQEEFRDQRYCQGWEESDRVPGWPGQTVGRFAAWLADARATVTGEGTAA